MIGKEIVKIVEEIENKYDIKIDAQDQKKKTLINSKILKNNINLKKVDGLQKAAEEKNLEEIKKDYLEDRKEEKKFR